MSIDSIFPAHTALGRAVESEISNFKSPIPRARSKYIIVSLSGFELAILFPECIRHDQAINADVPRVSAGFFHLTSEHNVVTEAEPSTSLKLQPRPQDAEIIHNTLLLLGLL